MTHSCTCTRCGTAHAVAFQGIAPPTLATYCPKCQTSTAHMVAFSQQVPDPVAMEFTRRKP